MINENSLIAASKDIETAELEGEAVLLDISTGLYFGLSAVGARIMAMLKNPIHVREIISTLSTEYDVSLDQLRSDIVEFLKDMQDRNLIQTLDREVA